MYINFAVVSFAQHTMKQKPHKANQTQKFIYRFVRNSRISRETHNNWFIAKLHIFQIILIIFRNN